MSTPVQTPEHISLEISGLEPNEHAFGEQRLVASETALIDRLQVLFTFSPRAYDEIAHCIESATRPIEDRAVTDWQFASLDIVRSGFSWRYLGDIGTRLPEAYVLTPDSNPDKANRTSPAVHPMLLKGFDVAHTENRVMYHPRMRKVADVIQNDLGGRIPEIDQVLRQLVLQSDEVQFLRSFAQNAEKTKYTSLNPFWRYVRERSIEDDIQCRYGLQPDDILQTGTPAWREYHTRVHALDDEQILSKVKDPQDPLERLKKFFVPFIEVGADGRGTNVKITGFKKRDNEFNCWTEVQLQGSFLGSVNLVELTDRAASEFRLQFGKQDERADRIYQFFIMHFINQLFLDKTTDLDILINECADRTAGIIRGRLFGALYSLDLPEGPNDGLFNDLLRADKAGTPFLSYDDYSEKYREASITAHPSWERQGENKSSLINYEDSSLDATLIQARNIRRSTGRIGLINSETTVDTPHLSVQKPEITLEMKELFPGATLSILGYTAMRRLIGGDRMQITYVHDPENDPYNTCAIPIDSRRLEQLCEIYESIGLDKTVQAIKRKSNLTVDELTNILSATNKYRNADEESYKSVIMEVDTFQDFKDQIQEGVLHYQCSGAATFLGMSLEVLFPNYTSTRISGYTIPSEAGSSEFMSHAQVFFPHEGKKYVLDATPSNGGPARGFHFRDVLRNWLQTGSKSTKVISTDTSEDVKVDDNKPKSLFEVAERNSNHIPEKTPTELHANTLRRVESLLQVTLDTTKKDFYKTVARLSKRDPVRQALAAARTNLEDSDFSTRINETIERLEKYLEIPANLREKLQLGHYSAEIIEQLQRELQRLSQLKTS